MSDYSSTYNSPVDAGAGSQSWNIDPWLKSCRIQVWGAGGGGEFIAANAALTPTAGGNGGDSSIFGVTAGGGYGGGRRNNGTTAKGVGGNGGTASISGSPNWTGLGVSIETTNGTRGTQNDGGTVDTTPISADSYKLTNGNGGDGTEGFRTYTSYSTHVFNNDSNTNVVTTVSSDITITYLNPSAEGQNGDRPVSGKCYGITFNDAFIDDTWTYSLTHAQQAAGGSTGGAIYRHSGFRFKTSSGFRIWFETSGGGNTYIRWFEILATGIKPGAQGRGGGGGSYVEFELTRQNLIDAGYDMNPYNDEGVQDNFGDLLNYTVGSEGSSSVTNGEGDTGRVIIKWYEIPQVYLSANRTTLTAGQSAQLTWYTEGDADSLSFTSGGIANTNLNSFTPQGVTPAVTTTYTATATGIGGTSYNNEASVTIFVYQIPTISGFEVPTTVDYGTSTITVEYDANFCDISLEIKISYSYDEGPEKDDGFIEGETISIAVDDVSPFVEPDNSQNISGTVDINLPWTEWGPAQFSLTLEATGSGGNVNTSAATSVIIDREPDNLDIDGRGTLPEDLIIDATAISPGIEVVDQGFELADIDIPVEVKSNYPIQVSVNSVDTWNNVREL